jgi:hypothetical protein
VPSGSFGGFLIGATTVSLIGNIAHAVLPYIPRIDIQIGAAAVPPIALLAAVHGIALAVRAGASGRVYRWSIAAVAVIGAGAFMLSFRALRDLLIQTRTPPAWAWILPAIIDTAVAVSTLMLVALGDKPARRARAVTSSGGTQTPTKETTVGATPDSKCDQRCRQGIWDQLQDGSADRAGCRRASAAATRGGGLTGQATPNRAAGERASARRMLLCWMFGE